MKGKRGRKPKNSCRIGPRCGVYRGKNHVATKYRKYCGKRFLKRKLGKCQAKRRKKKLFKVAK
jgi:hypothetical protein